MCRGRGQAFYIHPCPSPPPSITRLIFPSPLPQSLRNLQRLLSAAHQTGLFFYIGLCETFSGISDWWGCILLPAPPFLIFFLKTKFFCIFHNAFVWGQCHQQAGLPPSILPLSSWLPPSILLASSLHPLGFLSPSSGLHTQCCFGVAALPFLFPVSFWILSSAVQSQAGRALAMCLGDDAGFLPPCLPSLHPFSSPQAAFFRLQPSLQQPFYY